MTAEFQQLADFAQTMYAKGFSRIGEGEFAVSTGLLTLHFAPVAAANKLLTGLVRAYKYAPGIEAEGM